MDTQTIKNKSTQLTSSVNNTSSTENQVVARPGYTQEMKAEVLVYIRSHPCARYTGITQQHSPCSDAGGTRKTQDPEASCARLWELLYPRSRRHSHSTTRPFSNTRCFGFSLSKGSFKNPFDLCTLVPSVLVSPHLDPSRAPSFPLPVSTICLFSCSTAHSWRLIYMAAWEMNQFQAEYGLVLQIDKLPSSFLYVSNNWCYLLFIVYYFIWILY